MKQSNIKRLERAAGMLEKCADLISDVVFNDGDTMTGDNCYWFKQQARDLRYIVSGITRIAKVAKEDAANEV